MSQEKNFKLLRNIVQLCEYMYRKGVLDAAICGDAFEINECIERDDTFETFRFLRDEEGDELNINLYCDYLTIMCRKVSAFELRNQLMYGTGPLWLKTCTCIAADNYYRKGLNDGKTASKVQAEGLMNSIQRGFNHERIDGTKMKMIDFIDELKYEMNAINRRRKKIGLFDIITGFLTFIGECMYEYRYNQEKRAAEKAAKQKINKL